MPQLPGSPARRAFLKRLGHLGIAGTAMPWALNLAAMSDVAAQTGGYKALVCIFLYGGNDHGNTVVPYDSATYNDYSNTRGGTDGLAIPRGRLLALEGDGLDAGRQYSLAPELTGLRDLFNQEKLAVQMNVGPLIRPTTLEQYRRRTNPLPPKLFSHNDQQSVWQSSRAEGAIRGWGGSMGDLMMRSNGNSLFTCVSVTGNAVLVSGQSALPYQIGTDRAIDIWAATQASGAYGSDACRAALRQLITEGRGHVLENEINAIAQRSITAQSTLSGVMQGTESLFDAFLPNRGQLFVDGQTVERNFPLNRQLKMVARLIAARQRLGMQRQVFMVSLGGFDNHDYLRERHPNLLTQVNAAMTGFQAALESMGVGDQVTTFTASEFGRTMVINGDGSDHAWGAHHFVMGGAVKGKAFYGKAPSAMQGGEEDVGNGRYIPSTSVDQYAATLARWFGVSDANMSLIAPNIGNFGTSDLGFMN